MSRFSAAGLVLSILVVAFAGCAMAPRAVDGPSAPIDAWLGAEGPGDAATVAYVNQPAYGVVLDVVPGRFVRVLHPYEAGSAVRLAAGVSMLPRPFRPNFVLATADRQRPSVGYLVFIASRAPLDVARLGPRAALSVAPPARYRPELLHGTPRTVLDNVIGWTVGDLDQEAWDVDVVPYWGGTGFPSGRVDALRAARLTVARVLRARDIHAAVVQSREITKRERPERADTEIRTPEVENDPRAAERDTPEPGETDIRSRDTRRPPPNRPRSIQSPTKENDGSRRVRPRP